jgi:hypothetical protein
MPPLVSIFQSTISDDGISSKRVVTFLAFIFCSIAFFADLFFGLKVDKNLYDGMMYIAIAGLGVTASEKFASKPPEPPAKSLLK